LAAPLMFRGGVFSGHGVERVHACQTRAACLNRRSRQDTKPTRFKIPGRQKPTYQSTRGELRKSR